LDATRKLNLFFKGDTLSLFLFYEKKKVGQLA